MDFYIVQFRIGRYEMYHTTEAVDEGDALVSCAEYCMENFKGNTIDVYDIVKATTDVNIEDVILN